MDGKSNTITMINRVAVIILLCGIFYQAKTTHDEIRYKLKYELEFLKSEQSNQAAGIEDVQQKLKYDLEFIKANQATLRENHMLLEKLLEK